MKIQNLSFNITKYPNQINSNIWFYFEPKTLCDLFTYYQDVCRTMDEFDQILLDLNAQKKLDKPTKNLGRNESSLLVYGDNCLLDCEFISGIPPTEVDTDDVIYFFSKFRDFFIKYENCEIPGIIPESKIDTWSCVPNEYVKPEYWGKFKDTEGDSGETAEST